jgi:dienelactone hydrolase
MSPRSARALFTLALLPALLAHAANAQSSAPPSYDAPAGAPYVALQVVVRAASGEEMGGTLTVPCGAHGTVPAVVLVSGTGPQDRDGSLPGDPYRPFRQIADTLSRRGIAVLRVDDRGVGTGGRRQISSVNDLADDVRAALAMLRARGELDPARLAVVGHSEGAAVLSLVAASDPSLRAIALLGGPAERLRDALDEQVRTAVERDRSLETAAQRDSALRVRTASQQRVSARLWSPASLDYDPLVPARAVRSAAVLVLHGATDWQVLPRHADRYGEAFREAGNRDVTVRVLPGIDHLMLRDADGNPDGYERLASQDLPPEVLGPLADWMAARLGAGTGGAARPGSRAMACPNGGAGGTRGM